MDPELYHWGIKGMRWGIRRYQNPDGTLTPEGRARYIRSDGSLTRRARRKGVEKILSTEDLKIVNNRLDLERQYRNATGNEKSEQRPQGQKKESVIGKTFSDIMTNGAKTMADAGFRKLAKKTFEDEKKKDEYTKLGQEWTRKQLDKAIKEHHGFENIPVEEIQTLGKGVDVMDNVTRVADGDSFKRNKK